jgi:hypothetical protein
MKPINGLTLWVCFGSYGGFHARCCKDGVGITLGWVSMQIMPFDVENVLRNFVEFSEQKGGAR